MPNTSLTESNFLRDPDDVTDEDKGEGEEDVTKGIHPIHIPSVARTCMGLFRGHGAVVPANVFDAFVGDDEGG